MHATFDLTALFLAGVIEGFYGQPWSSAERAELLEWMSQWGLNTYVYAPKDDLKQRAIWRELYSEVESRALADLIQNCATKRVRFVYALSPGLDIRYSDDRELRALEARCDQMLTLGCRDFALLFDDIPDQVSPEVIARWGSLASAQCRVANSLRRQVASRAPAGRFLFCPTPYCGRMARAGLGGSAYLETLGRQLAPEIDVFWTGPEIISETITVEHVRELQEILRRKPVIWDNLHANDYDGRRFYCGPYSGRPPQLRDEVRGLLANPNCEFPLNFVPLWTLARLARCETAWDDRTEYLAAMREWHPRFGTVTEPQIPYEDLVLLGDCFYLPHHEGPEAEALIESALAGVMNDSRMSRSADQLRGVALRLRRTCARLTELRDRPLFYALSRRIWDLREELDLLERFIAHRAAPEANARGSFTSDFHLPRTYQGGTLARLQRLLRQQPDGSFMSAAPHP